MQLRFLGGDRLRNLIKELLRPFDYLIFLAAFYLFATFDYDNLDTGAKVYIVTFTLWFAMIIIRGAILYKKINGRKKH